MRTSCWLTLTLLVTLGPGCSDDKDPTVTTASAPTTPSSDPGTGEGETSNVTTSDGGETSESSQTTQTTQTTANPTTNDPTTNETTTNDPSTTGMTTETTTTANPTTADPTTNQTTQTTDPTADPTGDPDEAATQLCVDTINMYRGTLGLPPYQRWTDAETCSDGEAQSDGQTNTPHGAFGTCGEFAQNECPGWPAPPETMIENCLAQMWAEGPGDDFQTHGHYINMSSESYTQVACGFAIVNGQVWAVQNFR